MTPHASRSSASLTDMKAPPGLLAGCSNEGETGESASGQTTRLLIPINASPASRWGISYALARQAAGEDVEVVFLNVAEPIDQWQVLRSWTRRQADDFQLASAQAFIDDACAPLLRQDIACRGFFRQGPIVQTIIDFAHECGCAGIVVPLPANGWRRIMTRGIVEVLLKRERDIAVITVDAEGIAHPSADA